MPAWTVVTSSQTELVIDSSFVPPTPTRARFLSVDQAADYLPGTWPFVASVHTACSYFYRPCQPRFF